MILRTETVDQIIDGTERGTFLKEVVLTRGTQPLGMVRKRLPPPAKAKGVVLLVHGFGQNRYTWHVTRRSFSSFLASRGWDVFNLDLRGHGRSRGFGAVRPKGLDDYIREDVPACAREALRLAKSDRLFVIGHSMGGLIGYSVAATSLREEVRGVVSIGAPYRFGLGSRWLKIVSMLASAVHFGRVLDVNPPFPLRFIGRHLKTSRALWDLRMLPMPYRAWAPGSVEEDILDEYLHRAFDATSLAVGLDIVRSGQADALKSRDGRTNYGEAFEALDKPLLVVAGTHDHWAPLESVKPAFERSNSSDKTFRAFPLGHIDLIVGREAPTTVWPAVLSWIDKR